MDGLIGTGPAYRRARISFARQPRSSRSWLAHVVANMRKQLRHPWYLWPNRPEKSSPDMYRCRTRTAVETVRTAVDPTSGATIRLVRTAPTPAPARSLDQPTDDQG